MIDRNAQVKGSNEYLRANFIYQHATNATNIGSIKGFSPQNLWRMKQFYEIYHNDKILSPLVREISWSNNLMILSRTKDRNEKEFYIRLSIKENYSKRELERQIESGFYE